MRTWAILAALILTPSLASAGGLFSQESPTLNRKVRNLGMGNVGVAIRGTADSSPFYNPAGLNDLTEGRFQFLTMTADVAQDSIGMIGDVMDFVDKVDAATTDSGRLNELDAFISDHSGEFQHIRFALDVFNYARKNFAAGLLIDERIDITFREQQYFDIRTLGDAALFVAGAHDFADRLIQVGVTLRPTMRFALDEQDQRIGASDVLGENASGDTLLGDQFKNIKDRRFGLGVDLGVKSDLSRFKDIPGVAFLKPAVGLTWQDIGGPSFALAEGNEQSVSIGVAVFPDVWKLKNTFAIDIRDLNQEEDFLPRLHIGAESLIYWKKFGLGLRVGVSQGYFSGGLTADLWFVKLDAAYYGEEVGTKTTRHGSPRFAGTLSFNI